MKNILSLMLLNVFLLTSLNALQKGKVIGGSMHEAPDWFKESFLDISDDIEEAQENNKHIMLFMDLDGCPYCTRMLNESFVSKNETSDFAKSHFDVINLNVKGSREIAWSEDETLTEKQLAQKLKVQYSPTVLFLDYDKNIVVRINGYRSAKNFKNILKYVQGKHYKNMELSEFLEKHKDKSLYSLKSNKMFKKITDLSDIDTPLAVIFEDGSCTQCDYFHNRTLKHNDVINELKKFTVVRLDASSNTPIIDTDGKKTTPKKWADSLKLDYRPGILLYNKGELVSTVDALLYNFHFKELLRYVSGGHYEKYNGYLIYLRIRQKELLNQGIDVDISK
jgi:thioredoxin-related protein